MSKTIEIQRKIERFKGNKMVFNKLRQGAYQMRTGEAGGIKERTSLYADQFDDEIDEFVDRIDREEELRMNSAEKKHNARELRKQIHEGRSKLTLRFHEKSK